jgi:D-glycero-alpha-D-manno-heptose-7-phosphate kinase
VAAIKEYLQQRPVDSSAPCRIDMGGTLDLSTFYLPLHHFDPCTFNAALDLRTRIRLEASADDKLLVTSRGFNSLEVDLDSAPFDHPLGLMILIAVYFKARGVHIHIDSASPPRSSLGGSSVAAVALIWAFHKAMQPAGEAMPDPGAVAHLAYSLEQSIAGVPCGFQDQLAAVYGGMNAWRWTVGPNGPCYERQSFNPSRAKDFSKRILVAYCGIPHVSKDVNTTWVRGFLGGHDRAVWPQIVDLSHRFVQALMAGDWDSAGQAMNQETDLRMGLTPDVLDQTGRLLVSAARDHHCGARFAGAGGGGCIWTLGADENQISSLRGVWQNILDGVENAKLLDTAVDHRGIL